MKYEDRLMKILEIATVAVAIIAVGLVVWHWFVTY
jgi:hypothetical protein